jgi:hypothetical protein
LSGANSYSGGTLLNRNAGCQRRVHGGHQRGFDHLDRAAAEIELIWVCSPAVARLEAIAADLERAAVQIVDAAAAVGARKIERRAVVDA